MENKIIFDIDRVEHRIKSIEVGGDTAQNDNAIVEIQKLLITKDLIDIKIEDIQKIATKYSVNLKKEFKNEYLDFYRVYLRHCLTDKYLSEEELGDLKQLKQLLTLTDKEINNLHKEIAGEIYRDELEIVLEDGRIDDDERVFLNKLQSDLKLNDDFVQKIFKESAYDLVRKFLNGAILDKRLSPDEEEELEAITRSLGIEIEFGEATKLMLAKYKLFWQIENDNIPQLDCDIKMNDNEVCYFILEGKWHNSSKPKELDDDTDLELRIKIAKGIYWTLLNLGEKDLVKKWNLNAGGSVLLTNNRLLLLEHGSIKCEFDISNLIDIKPYQNGIEIYVPSGENLFIELNENIDIMVMMLGKAFSDL